MRIHPHLSSPDTVKVPTVPECFSVCVSLCGSMRLHVSLSYAVCAGKCCSMERHQYPNSSLCPSLQPSIHAVLCFIPHSFSLPPPLTFHYLFCVSLPSVFLPPILLSLPTLPSFPAFVSSRPPEVAGDQSKALS